MPRPDGSRACRAVFVGGPQMDWDPRFSPTATGSRARRRNCGRSEIYVKPFPGPGLAVRYRRGRGIPDMVRHEREIVYELEGQVMISRYDVHGAH